MTLYNDPYHKEGRKKWRREREKELLVARKKLIRVCKLHEGHGKQCVGCQNEVTDRKRYIRKYWYSQNSGGINLEFSKFPADQLTVKEMTEMLCEIIDHFGPKRIASMYETKTKRI